MLTYVEFKKIIKMELVNYLPEELKEAIVFRKVTKVNQELEAVSLHRASGPMSAGPTLYIKDLYDNYTAVMDVDKVMKQAVKILVDHSNPNLVFSDFTKDFLKDKVFLELINTEKNQKLLKKAIHRSFLDLSIIYRASVNILGDNGSFIIDQGTAKQLGFSEEELYELAMINTPQLYPFVTDSMAKIILRLYEEKGIPCEIPIEVLRSNCDDNGLYVITNKNNTFGANVMLFSDELAEISKKVGGNYYILPSSLHEIIVVGENIFDEVDRLWEMVSEVNTNHVAASEVLSDTVYKYVCDSGEVIVAEREMKE